jgi:formylglycine-generating enzyme required for sulfatase activity
MTPVVPEHDPARRRQPDRGAFRYALLGAVVLSACSSKTEPLPEPPVPASAATVSASASAAAPPPRPRPMAVSMIALKGGIFTMGHDGLSPEGELDDSQPSHNASVPPFQIDVTEVTVDAYRRCVEDGACSVPENRKRELLAEPLCTWYEADRGNHPINCVTWYQADAYCKWAGKQLPTEEMWEFAARGKTDREFPWGRSAPNSRWGIPPGLFERLYGSCKTETNHPNDDTCPVGSAPKGATPEGVLDLAGNVAEWTASQYCSYTTKKCDPDSRILRGGTNNWYGAPYILRNVMRWSAKPKLVWSWFGFRCAKLGAP